MTMQAFFWGLHLLKAASDAGMQLMHFCIQKIPASSYVRCRHFLDAALHFCIAKKQKKAKNIKKVVNSKKKGRSRYEKKKKNPFIFFSKCKSCICCWCKKCIWCKNAFSLVNALTTLLCTMWIRNSRMINHENRPRS